MTPAMAGDLLDAALAKMPIDPVVTAPDRRKRLSSTVAKDEFSDRRDVWI